MSISVTIGGDMDGPTLDHLRAAQDWAEQRQDRGVEQVRWHLAKHPEDYWLGVRLRVTFSDERLATLFKLTFG